MTLDTSFCDVARFANRTRHSGEIFRDHRARRNSYSRPTPQHHTLQPPHPPPLSRHLGRGLLRRLNSRASCGTVVCGTVVARPPSRSRRGRAALRGRSPQIAPARRGRGKCAIALAREDGDLREHVFGHSEAKTGLKKGRADQILTELIGPAEGEPCVEALDEALEGDGGDVMAFPLPPLPGNLV